jgi:hypothetical protein
MSAIRKSHIAVLRRHVPKPLRRSVNYFQDTLTSRRFSIDYIDLSEIFPARLTVTRQLTTCGFIGFERLKRTSQKTPPNIRKPSFFNGHMC